MNGQHQNRDSDNTLIAYNDLLSCECQYLDRLVELDLFRLDYRNLKAVTKYARFPLIIGDIDTLVDLFEEEMNSSDYLFTRQNIIKYRQSLCDEAQDIDINQCFEDTLVPTDLTVEDLNQTEADSALNHPDCLIAHLDMIDNRTLSGTIVASVDVELPYQLASFLPVGEGFYRPTPMETIAIAKYWYQKYGAVVAAISLNQLEFYVARPPLTIEDARILAQQQFAFCNDVVLQGVGSLAGLALLLVGRRHWYFWWD